MAAHRSLKDLGEEGLIRWIASRHPDEARGVILGIGDDAAALRFSPGALVIASADTVVEGVHFDRAWHTPERIGRKAVAVNVSDMAAMGARGRYLLCQAGLPSGTSLEFFERCMKGLMAFAGRHGLALAGGDLSATRGPLFLALTILGEARRGKLLTRAGARPGDLLAVSGRPGESAAGLALLKAGLRPGDRAHGPVIRRHLEPEPRVELARVAVGSGAVTAATDVSDGLSTDLLHLCLASGLAAEVDPCALPVSRALARGAARLGADPVRLILDGGEDYELLMAVRPRSAGRFLRMASDAGQEVTVIGRFLRGRPGARLLTPSGIVPLRPGGYNHFR